MEESKNFKDKINKEDNELERFLKKIFRIKKDNTDSSPESLDNEHDLKEEVNESILLINSLSFNKYEFPEADKESVWNNINTSQSDHHYSGNTNNPKTFFYWAKIASFFIFLISLIAFYFVYNADADYFVVSTKYGETKKVKLPDGSEVVLNANSVLKYKKENSREVFIKGEAFFSVVHTKDDRKFEVRTFDNLSILVLGTTFNVYNREQNVKVVLYTGKIKLQREGKSSVEMRPGELVEFKTLENYSKREVDPRLYTSWTNKKLIFNNTSISELAILIEDTYGIAVSIPEEELKDLKISGTIINEDLDGLLIGISETLDLKISKTEDGIIFKSKN